MALTDKLTDIADAIRAKTGESDLLTLDEMPSAIASISGGGEVVDVVPQTINYTTSLAHHFANDKYKWLIENYNDRLQFNDISALGSAFNNCTLLPTNDIIVSSLGLPQPVSGIDAFSRILYNDNTGLFQEIPYIKGGYLGNCTTMFQYAHIRFPDNWFNQFTFSNGSGSNLSIYAMFNGSIIHQIVDMNNESIVDNQQFNSGRYVYSLLPFNYIYNNNIYIDGLINIPVGSTKTKPTTVATMTWPDVVCKKLTFKLNNGVPYHANWNLLTLDLSHTGWIAMSAHNVVNSEMVKWFGQGDNTENLILQHQITDAASAENLKDDPWRWSSYVEGSLYNKTAALETIATLPDLTASNSTATIIFSGDAGAFTSGGAISSMTTAEQDIATAKGWTISFV